MTHKKFIGAVLTTTAGLVFAQAAHADVSWSFGLSTGMPWTPRPYVPVRHTVVVPVEPRRVFVEDRLSSSLRYEIRCLEDEVNCLREDLATTERAHARTKQELELTKDRNTRLEQKNADLEKEIKELREKNKENLKTNSSWFNA